MRGSLFMIGFMMFAIGMVLMLPAIVLSAAGTNIQTKGQAVSLIAGNVVKDLKVNTPNSFAPSSIISKLPALLVAIGIVLLAIAFFFKF